MHISIACPTTPHTGSIGKSEGDLTLNPRPGGQEFDHRDVLLVLGSARMHGVGLVCAIVAAIKVKMEKVLVHFGKRARPVKFSGGIENLWTAIRSDVLSVENVAELVLQVCCLCHSLR